MKGFISIMLLSLIFVACSQGGSGGNGVAKKEDGKKEDNKNKNEGVNTATDSGSQSGYGSYCATYTTCSDGHKINCNATGNSCTWSYQESQSVVCIGYDGENFTGTAHKSTLNCR